MDREQLKNELEALSKHQGHEGLIEIEDVLGLMEVAEIKVIKLHAMLKSFEGENDLRQI